MLNYGLSSKRKPPSTWWRRLGESLCHFRYRFWLLTPTDSISLKHYLRGEETIYYEDLYHLVKYAWEIKAT